MLIKAFEPHLVSIPVCPHFRHWGKIWGKYKRSAANDEISIQS